MKLVCGGDPLPARSMLFYNQCWQCPESARDPPLGSNVTKNLVLIDPLTLVHRHISHQSQILVSLGLVGAGWSLSQSITVRCMYKLGGGGRVDLMGGATTYLATTSTSSHPSSWPECSPCRSNQPISRLVCKSQGTEWIKWTGSEKGKSGTGWRNSSRLKAIQSHQVCGCDEILKLTPI